MTANITTVQQVLNIVQEARNEAGRAARAALAQYGDRDACGFAWTDICGIKGSTRLGRLFTAAGVRKSYTGAFQIWNPSGVGCQSISVLEAGAQAAADVFCKHGFTAYAGSRMD